ncbi:unnamed protein product [Pleuronectes platessa]|uniref:Uncharacterized protein n=1 Tax=Pleuronectes platessa TaxID=8262 RepID=A0A9N7VJN0_PLEPL|nr:unnamed protein product [Pleuronectes platessa]
MVVVLVGGVAACSGRSNGKNQGEPGGREGDGVREGGREEGARKGASEERGKEPGGVSAATPREAGREEEATTRPPPPHGFLHTSVAPSLSPLALPSVKLEHPQGPVALEISRVPHGARGSSDTGLLSCT